MDLVQRRFYAQAPNQLWVADATYIPTWAGFLYLAMVLDVYSRKVVGWAMGNSLDTELMLAALNMAITHTPTAGRHPSLGPRLPIHQLCLRKTLQEAGDHTLDGLGRRCVRQCHGRIVFRHP